MLARPTENHSFSNSEFPIFQISDYPNLRFSEFPILRFFEFPIFRTSDFPAFRKKMGVKKNVGEKKMVVKKMGCKYFGVVFEIFEEFL